MLTFIEPCLYLERESPKPGTPYYVVHTKIKLTGVAKCNAFLMGWGGRKGLCMCVGTTWVRATSIELQQS